MGNNLNPVGKADNEFVFSLEAADNTLYLEVMNANVRKDNSLGTASLTFEGLTPGQWIRRREPLKDGKDGELELEVRLEREAAGKEHSEATTESAAKQARA